MKRLAVLTISLLIAFGALGGITAFAAESSTVYPQDGDFIKPLVFSDLSDYAVSGETYAFAEGKTVSVYTGGSLTQYLFEGEITALDCAEGIFYCRGKDGKVYSLPDKKTSEHAMPEEKNIINLDNYTYKLTDATLEVADFNTKEIVTFDGAYSNLKQFGEIIYAISDNCLYSFSQAKSTKLSLEYADFSSTQKIAVGQAATALKNYTLEFVTVEAGAFMTKVDLTSIEGEYFVTGETVTARQSTTALLLCRTGNAEIIAIGDDSYILLASKTTDNVQLDCYVEKEFDNATIIGNRIYASPYVIIGTSSVPNASGMKVSVLRKLECEGVLGSAYYEVLYMTENVTKVGYVADGFLTELIIEDNKQPTTIPDPDHSEDNNIRTVLLVLAVVVLVLFAVGYLAYIGTSDKRKKKKEEKSEKPKTEK